VGGIVALDQPELDALLFGGVGRFTEPEGAVKPALVVQGAIQQHLFVHGVTPWKKEGSEGKAKAKAGSSPCSRPSETRRRRSKARTSRTGRTAGTALAGRSAGSGPGTRRAAASRPPW